MKELLEQIIADRYATHVAAVVTRPEAQFGDYTTNVALQLAKPLGRNPRDIATELAEALRSSGDFLTVEVAGPGFINVRLAGDALLRLARQEPTASRIGTTVVIETNNPNPFKAMHIGHGMNAVVGDTIANLLAVSGAKVNRVSYHGDVGLHVGKSMYALLRYADGNITKIETIPPSEHNTFMSRMYAEGSRAYKEDPEAKQQIDLLAKESFAPHDPLYARIYELCKQWSFDGIDALVKRLGNQPTVQRFLESAADAKGVPTVREHVPRVFQESDGAVVFPGSQFGSFDNAFIASNGNGLYGARDIGLIQLKHEQFHADEYYIVTGEEQAAYFRGVIAAADQLWGDTLGRIINIPTGLVKLSTGKMSSRDGDVIEVAWLFTEFKKAIEARGGVADDSIVAGAIRYQFLKVKIGSDVVFDVNDAVSLTGNTGSYLQYAHARAKSILRKASEAVRPLETIRDEDRRLVRKVSEYHEVVDSATRQLEPHHICTYLFELAQEFNRYYETNQVIGSDAEHHRVALVAMYADTLRAGLAVLGIDAPEMM